jgi:hypothetical protein
MPYSPKPVEGRKMNPIATKRQALVYARGLRAWLDDPAIRAALGLRDVPGDPDVVLAYLPLGGAEVFDIQVRDVPEPEHPRCSASSPSPASSAASGALGGKTSAKPVEGSRGMATDALQSSGPDAGF